MPLTRREFLAGANAAALLLLLDSCSLGPIGRSSASPSGASGGRPFEQALSLLRTSLRSSPDHLVARAEEWAAEHGALRISLTSALHRESAHKFYKARDYEHTGVRLTKVFVNRSGAPRRGKSRSSRTGVADDARNSRGQ
jgi:GNAT superfamily N-acetyltransferase